MSQMIRAFKMVSGEEVIAEIQHTQTKTFLTESEHFGRTNIEYHLRRPHVLQIQQVAPGKLGMALVPLFLSNHDAEEVIVLASSLLTVPVEPHSAVQKQYLDQTSGLAIATGSLQK